MEVRNFLFHRVSNEVDNLWPPMTPNLFEKIIRHLKKRYQIVLIEDLLGNENNFGLKSKKLATIQFDDGYKDNIEYAAPILKKYGCPASFYVVTGCIDSGLPTWTYLLDHALQHTQTKVLELSFDFVPDDKKNIHINPNQKISRAARFIKPLLKKLPNGQRIKILNSILDQCNSPSVSMAAMMNWADIRHLGQQGFYVGSHSLSHPLLANIETENEILFELKKSAQRIEEETGKRPLTISYPIGSFDDRVIKLAKECGYQYGLAVKHRFFNTDKDSKMVIPRVELYQEPLWKTYMRISGLITLFK